MSSKMIGKVLISEEPLQKDLQTIAQFPILEEEYAEFGIGSWKNHSLWNENGDFADTQYRAYDTSMQITELGEKLPYITQLIKENFDMTYLKMVRARNLINGFVIPHKDFVEFNQSKTYYLRVFIPLENNTDSYHSDEKSVFQMQKGEVWRLDASIVHAAANFGSDSRVHLCLDFQFPEKQPHESIFLNPGIAEAVVPPTVPTRKILHTLEDTLQQLTGRINKTNILETIVDLTKLHFHYDVSILDCYDWLIKIARQSGCEEILEKSRSLKKYMIESRELGERFAF